MENLELLKLLNSKLHSIQDLIHTIKDLVQETIVNEYTTRVFKLDGDIYMKIGMYEDSYGEDIVSSIEFVKPKQVSIIEFEKL